MTYEAYLDIETTGLSSVYCDITVIGMYLTNENDSRIAQLVGEEVTKDNLVSALKDVKTIYTYNGSRFDIPFIRNLLGIDLAESQYHHDLMYDCWDCNLYGGFKGVEQQLGITRQLPSLSGLDAVILWREYRNRGDQRALELLLKYNEEDVVNLCALRERLIEIYIDSVTGAD
jgi:hypothetical protein